MSFESSVSMSIALAESANSSKNPFGLNRLVKHDAGLVKAA